MEVTLRDTGRVADFTGALTGSHVRTLVLEGVASGEGATLADMATGCTTLESASLTHVAEGAGVSLERMFAGCTSLASLALEDVATGTGDSSRYSVLKDLASGCSSLASVEMTRVATGGYADMTGAFADLASLATLALEDVGTGEASQMSLLHAGAPPLRMSRSSVWAQDAPATSQRCLKERHPLPPSPPSPMSGQARART